MDALPQLVACERHEMRLTQAACSRFWQSANPVPPPQWEGRHACYRCPVGAARTGVTMDPLQGLRDGLAKVCCRCCRTAVRIVAGRFCPSCYNRAREVRVGRNRKGGVPRIVAGRLGVARVVAVEGGQVEHLEAVAAGPLELVLWRVRAARGALAFGWAPGALAGAA
jgi:hypothetical protein